MHFQLMIFSAYNGFMGYNPIISQERSVNTIECYSDRIIQQRRICSYLWQMNGPWGHDAKWNMPERERKMPHDIVYMWNLK